MLQSFLWHRISVHSDSYIFLGFVNIYLFCCLSAFLQFWTGISAPRILLSVARLQRPQWPQQTQIFWNLLKSYDLKLDSWDTDYMTHLRHWLHCCQLRTTLLTTRSLGALRAPTSSLWPFGPTFGPSGLLDFVLRALRALRPCDPRTVAFYNPQKWIPSEILMIFLFFTSKIRHL